MADIDIDSDIILSILAEVNTCVDHVLGDADFIDVVGKFAPLTTEDTPAVVPVSNEDLEKNSTVAPMGNCKTSEDASNIVSSNKNNIFSALYSILSVYTLSITITMLRRFATRVGLTSHGKKCQVVLYLDLVDFKAIGSIVPTETEASEKVTINRCRYLNIIFSNVIRPLLATRGQSLNKYQLIEGVKKTKSYMLL